MKTRTLLAAITILLMAACQSNSTRTQNFIPGTYVNYAKGDYAEAYDTLVIKKVNDNNYQITRKTGYRAIRNGKLLPKHNQVKSFSAVYDMPKQELDETTTGRVFRFDVSKSVLLVNQAVYQKLN